MKPVDWLIDRNPVAWFVTYNPDEPARWPWLLGVGWAVACVAVPCLSLHAVAAAFQAVGIALTAFGVAALGDRVRWAAEKTTAARSRLVGWYRRRREQLAQLRSRLTGKYPATGTVEVEFRGMGAGSSSGTGLLDDRVDRGTISDRAWLAVLDDRVAQLFERLDAAEKQRTSDREEFERRLGIQRNELKAEIRRETRTGWVPVVWGLLYTLIGAVLAAFA